MGMFRQSCIYMVKVAKWNGSSFGEEKHFQAAGAFLWVGPECKP